MANWQAKRAATFAPRMPKLVVGPGILCYFCVHPKSSHSAHVLTAKCRVGGCDCPVFDPICGCRHLLSEHTWGTPPNPWECAGCKCLRFGADASGTVARAEINAVQSARPPSPPIVKPAPEVFEANSPYGAKLRWGRRDLALFDCHGPGCQDQATYWTTRAYVGKTGKWTTTRGYYCGPHFRRWADKWYPAEQLSIPGISPLQGRS